MEHVINKDMTAAASPARTFERAGTGEFLALTGAAVAMPLLLGHSQILTGVAVNMALALGAMRLGSWRRMAPLILLPSVSAVAAGALFGAPVWGLVALLPAIWAGNAAYAGLLRGRHGAAGNWFGALAVAALVKAGVIGAAALALVEAGVLPMGVAVAVAPLQLATAAVGGAMAWGVGSIIERES